MKFQFESEFTPKGDQPEAITQLTAGVEQGVRNQTLLGVTGSGKTFTMAKVINRIQMPTLVISHNKTLAAQLFQEFKSFFPKNAVEFFVSFYDYYQPEAYKPSTDTYIEKAVDINQEINRLRLRATSSLMSRRDVIIVASVSCIYNIGSPRTYAASSVTLETGQTLSRRRLFGELLKIQYSRNDTALESGTFRVRGDVIDVYPAYDEKALRLETFGDRIESISRINPVTGKTTATLEKVTIFPAKHYVASPLSMKDALARIHRELDEQVEVFESEGKLLEAQRLKQRTLYDIEMLSETGSVNGIENYSRILEGRPSGSRPSTLMDFFEPPYLTIIDESHVSVTQVAGMFNGDRARKETLVEHGFRLPCALDNRPLTFQEFEEILDFTIYSSATPGDYELEKSGGVVVEQVIRPTGLVDPPVVVKPAENQVDDLIDELRIVVEKKERVLVTTLTKRMAEDLTTYLGSLDFRVRYLHSEIDTLERPEILRDLRRGEFDILVGINLLREGLDLPEVSLVAILDADKEGFLRSARSLIQIAGRAARNINGRIVLYADTITGSIRRALDETTRRREKQKAYNKAHGIEPRSVQRKLGERIGTEDKGETDAVLHTAEPKVFYGHEWAAEPRDRVIARLTREMNRAAENLEFEKAAKLRDEINLVRAVE